MSQPWTARKLWSYTWGALFVLLMTLLAEWRPADHLPKQTRATITATAR